MPASTRFCFGSAGDDWVTGVDAALAAFLPEADDPIAVANATASGPAMSKGMFRAGVVILFDGGLEVWHRSAVLEQEDEGRFARVPSASIPHAKVGRRERRVECVLDDPDGEMLLSFYTFADDEAEARSVEEALTAWLVRESVAHGEHEIRTLSDVASSAVGGVRERATQTVDTLTLKEFRDDVEAAMGKFVEVLSVHEAEISRLQQRVDELTAALEARDRREQGPVT